MALEGLGRILDKELRALDKEIKTATDELLREISTLDPFGEMTLKRPKAARPREARTDPTAPSLDYAGLKQLFADASIERRYPQSTPQRIDLGPLHPYMQKLWQHTASSGKEYGRAAVLNVATGEVALGISRPGTDSTCHTEISFEMDGRHFAIFDMHTHPLDPSPRAKVKTRLHFSVEDIVSSLSFEQMIGNFVISGPEIAMLIKTSSIARNTDTRTARRHLERLLSEARAQGGSYADHTWEFTRFAALELGYSLYRNSIAAPAVLEKVPVWED